MKKLVLTFFALLCVHNFTSAQSYTESMYYSDKLYMISKDASLGDCLEKLDSYIDDAVEKRCKLYNTNISQDETEMYIPSSSMSVICKVNGDDFVYFIVDFDTGCAFLWESNSYLIAYSFYSKVTEETIDYAKTCWFESHSTDSYLSATNLLSSDILAYTLDKSDLDNINFDYTLLKE